jgi:CMP-N,N'-diacetyllegionaminic acid synthase
MIDGQKVLGIITARGGSKGLPGKNIRAVGGKPLLAWSIEAGAASRYIDRLVLSSDDDAIMEVARSYGCEVPFRRDPRLAADDTPGIDVVLDAIERCPGYDWVVLLQPTSPLRSVQDIDSALELCVANDAPACVSVCEARQSPYWMYLLEADARMKPLLPAHPAARRQELPAVYILNGAVYVARQNWLKATRDFKADGCLAYRMPLARSIDVDTHEDLLAVEKQLAERSGQSAPT